MKTFFSFQVLIFFQLLVLNGFTIKPQNEEALKAKGPLDQVLEITYPLTASELVPSVASLEWEFPDSASGLQYRVQVFNNSGEIYHEETTSENWMQVDGFDVGEQYFWRVRAEREGQAGNWSSFGAFVSSALDSYMAIEDASIGVPLEGRIPVLLVHGWNPNGKPASPSGAMWSNIRNFIKEDPVLNSKFKPYLVKYWSNAVTISELAAQFRDVLEQNGMHEQKVIILAHSMGGLVSRSMMNEYTFQKGRFSGQKCGELVKLLITLGTPHHGSPMANGPARDAKVPFLLKIYISLVESIAFDEVKYNEINRSNLHWDNYDSFLDYKKYPDERNEWLENLNTIRDFDRRLICYMASLEGKLFLSPQNTQEEFLTAAYLQEASLGYKNDGIVPIQSGSYAGHIMRKIRHFKGYNHSEINMGKTGESALFDSLKIDMLPFMPLLVEQPATSPLYLKGGSAFDIKWKAPADVEKVNLLYSLNNGKDYLPIANNIQANLGQYPWAVPMINSDSVLIKIENSSDTFETALAPVFVSVYHNDLVVGKPNSNVYCVWKTENPIDFSLTGIGRKLKISYHDLRNNKIKTVVDNLSVSPGNNTFAWNIDSTYSPSDSARLIFELLDMAERFGDSTPYYWSSGIFTLFGDPKITVSLAHDSIADEFGVSGKKLTIASLSQLEWKSEGEISHLSFFVCDSLKNKLFKLGSSHLSPQFTAKGQYSWKAPELHGDSFYLLAEAGPDSQFVSARGYNLHPFRINCYPEVTSPKNGEVLSSLLPCIQKGNTMKPDSSQLVIEASDGFSTHYTIKENQFCLPNTLADELSPGKAYRMIIWDYYQDKSSYGLMLSFTTRASKPLPFGMVYPTTGEVVNDSLVNISWNRSIGAMEYSMEVIYRHDTLAFFPHLAKTDTVAIANLGDWWHRDSLFVTITAKNEFGAQALHSYFFNSFKADTPYFEYDPHSSFQLNCYPNPMESTIHILFTLPGTQKNTRVELSVFNALGQKVADLFEKEMPGGTHFFDWDNGSATHKKIGPGVYFLRMGVGKKYEAKRLIIK